jgi:hypothetical protein
MGSRTHGHQAAITGGPLAAIMLAASFALSSCTHGQACGGQCGPPFQLQVIFRPGTSIQAAEAHMSACAWKPFVMRVGQVQHFHGTALAEPSGSLAATISTQSITSSRNHRLLSCLRRWRQVISADYPD